MRMLIFLYFPLCLSELNSYNRTRKKEPCPWDNFWTFPTTHKDYATNEEVRSRIQGAIGVHDDLLPMVKKRKLRWYGHSSRSSGMTKTILQKTLKGARWRGIGIPHQRMDRNGVWRFPEGSERQRKLERYCCNVIYGVQTSVKVKGLIWDKMRWLINRAS